jgi:hypothetical protein
MDDGGDDDGDGGDDNDDDLTGLSATGLWLESIEYFDCGCFLQQVVSNCNCLLLYSLQFGLRHYLHQI